MNIQDLEKELLKNPEFGDIYLHGKNLNFEISKMVINARIAKGLTQEKLAKKMGTKQPSIARIERGTSLPSLSFLAKMAEALNTELIAPKFEMLENKMSETSTIIYKEPASSHAGYYSRPIGETISAAYNKTFDTLLSPYLT